MDNPEKEGEQNSKAILVSSITPNDVPPSFQSILEFHKEAEECFGRISRLQTETSMLIRRMKKFWKMQNDIK